MPERPVYYKLYLRIISRLLQEGIVRPDMRVLVVCGGDNDKAAFESFGFKDVTIANLDHRMTGVEYLPYQWSLQDAEALSYDDNAFDLVAICAGLHHCRSPHRALLEAYRVARRCAVALEARDGFLSRIAVRLGVVDEYELTAVIGNDYQYGGVRNTSVPNYIYRWTEREVIKTIRSFAPHARHRFLWFHDFAPPVENLRNRKTMQGLLVLLVAYPFLWLLTRLFPSQCNLFGFAILKPAAAGDYHPWIKVEGVEPRIDRQWVEQHFLKRDA